MGERQGGEIGRGRLSIVRSDGDIAWKEYLHSVSPKNILDEAERTRIAAETGFPVPQVLFVEDRRLGLERIVGKTMLDSIKRPWDPWLQGRHLGQLHARMHQYSCLRLPNQKEVLRQRIQHAEGVAPDVKQRLLANLPKAMPDPRLCHGDFHPGNVILRTDGPVVIDWVDATSGWPIFDVARTVLLLLGAAHGTYERSPLARLLILWLLQGYKSGYRSLAPLSEKDLKRWLPTAAAVRLSEHIEEEENYMRQWLHDA